MELAGQEEAGAIDGLEFGLEDPKVEATLYETYFTIASALQNRGVPITRSLIEDEIPAMLSDLAIECEWVRLPSGWKLSTPWVDFGSQRVPEGYPRQFRICLMDSLAFWKFDIIEEDGASATPHTSNESSHKRLPSSVYEPNIAAKVRAYLETHTTISQTDFAGWAQTTDRTIRGFLKTGRVKRAIFKNIVMALRRQGRDSDGD